METLNPRPAGVTLEQQGGALLIRRSWYSAEAWFLLAFCVFWDGFLVFWYAMALQKNNHDAMMITFPLIHVGVGVFISYLVLATFLNQTKIYVGNGAVAVKHGPLPWYGNKTVSSYEIQQLYCDENTNYNRRNGRPRYRLNAVMKDGRKEVLVAAGLQLDQALYIERIAEEQLGIAAAPVVGEIGRSV